MTLLKHPTWTGQIKQQTLILTVLESGASEVQVQVCCLENTHVLARPFPITSHGARVQGAFPVLVYKGPDPIMKLHLLTQVIP